MSLDPRPSAIAIMGPTASGKTAFALEVAERFNGEIVSVDSALVYRGLDIGAAKPGADERARVPHHLLDVRDPWQVYSAADFAHDARRAMDDIAARGRLPVLAGGTGLYFQALLEGLAALPPADAALRDRIAARAQQAGWPALHAELARIDPEAAARIHATDPQRIQRALAGVFVAEWLATIALPAGLPGIRQRLGKLEAGLFAHLAQAHRVGLVEQLQQFGFQRQGQRQRGKRRIRLGAVEHPGQP